MYQAIQQALVSLLTTEGDRPRLRMDVERADQPAPANDERLALTESYRKAG